ncbi:FAD-dependent oxidoreductase [Nitrosopumilus piranensis]|uniref:Putative Monooxygenase FAD-binding n=1 Tax=Nitrosopumilus piranensis TaxID=1582439 RepID=A0A0C5BYH2_9ARCH|nr:NAD(P)/FAD-dependent oxidoreductase [Nitrosopumilus piranensis]AJM92010.1 putative Monooxygenase FAD-binding [Nitrosopumilus piranensis]
MFKKNVVIIGCGIAGPVLALALHRAGIKSEIFEARNESDTDSGLFHYISPNGMNVVNILEIYDKIKNVGYDCNGVIHYDENGNIFATMDETNEKEIYGVGSIMIQRKVLTKALREEVVSKGIKIHFDKKLKNIENTADSKIVAHFEDNFNTQGDLLVGCDGIHSRTRHIIMPNIPKPTYTNMIVSGGYTNIPLKDKNSNIIHTNYCKKAFLAYCILPDGEIWWWNGMSYPQEQSREELERISDEKWHRNLINLYDEDHDVVKELVHATSKKFLKYPIYEMPSIETWYKNNVCLIGDAAHALSPHAGQGASMAMEDAMMLAKCLRDVKDIQKAFEKFQQLRKKRVEKIAKIAHDVGENYFLTSPIKKRFRNISMKLMYTPFIFNRMAKFFFGYDVEWDIKVK